LKGLYIFLISLVLALVVGGIFLFKFWEQRKQLVVWDLVPESAILVYESTKTVENWNEIQDKAVWDNLEQIPYYASIGTKVKLLDSLSGSEGKLHKLLMSKPFVFSLHRVSQTDLDYLFFISLDDVSDFELIKTLVARYQTRDDFRFQDRSYQDILIHEAVNKEYEEVFSYLIHKNYFIGSFTPFLVEDVIRNISGQTKNSFALANAGLFEVAKLDNDQGNIYINNAKIPQLLSVFAKETLSPSLLPLGHLANSTFLDIKITDEQILLNGFTVTEPEDNPYLISVAGTQGRSLDFEGLISNEVATLYHLTFHNADIWHQKLRAYWKQHHKEQLDAWESLESQYGWNPAKLITSQRHGLAMAVTGTVDDESPQRLIYLRFSDPVEGFNQLTEAAEKSAMTKGDSVYVERYSGSEIRQISIKELPSKLWGGLFGGFEQSFFMPLEEYIVIGNSIQSLKELVTAVENEETWGRSITKSEFLENSLQEANLSYYVNLDKAWNLLDQQLSADWKAFLELHANSLKKFELLALQFSDIGDKFYTTGVLTYNGENPDPMILPRFQQQQQVYTEARITSRPFVVKNHNNGGREVLFQDSLNYLYLIGAQGRLLWQDSLAGSIKGELSQIDYYKNNKLQYLLASENQIHIIDRNGNSIDGFPISVPTNTRLRNVRAIDYDNSKRYRLIASDESGHVYMFDKQGKLLDGWNPKILQDQLLLAPQHIRVRGKDCIIAVQENGVIHVMNRRGNPYPGFPFDLGGSTAGPLFIDQGTNFENTSFTAITTQGQIFKFDLHGKVQEKRQLVKPSVDTRYQLCIEPLNRHYIIKRQNANRLGVLNRKGDVVFEKDYLSTADLRLQYYLLGNDHSIYAVSDPVQQFTYFYNQDGILVNSSPIESTGEIALLYFENQRQHNIYSVYDNMYALQSF
jgi:hypothetical protein